MVKNAGLRIATCEDPEYFIPVAQGHVSVVHLSQGYLCTRFAELYDDERGNNRNIRFLLSHSIRPYP